MSSIPSRQLGKNGPLVPRIGLGTMGLAMSYGKAKPDEQRLELLDRAYKIKETFWDTSDFYGDAEDIIGKWFAKTGKRSEIFLATKFGGILEDNGDFSFRGDAAYVSEACERSLKRLGTDYIDLWYPHRLDGSTPIEHIVAEMVKMKDRGKIRHIGLSEVSAATLRRAHAVHPIAAVQVEYSPFTTDIEDAPTALLAACRELGVAIVAYSPLSRGLLGGQIKSAAGFEPGDVRRHYPRFSAENLPRNMQLVGELERMAGAKGCTAAQLTLAWLLAQGDDIFPIPGTTKPATLEENCGAASVSLTPEEVAKIRSLADSAACRGDRYPPSHALALFADTPSPEEYARSQGLAGSEKKAISGTIHD
ncbi:Aldo/keto reductase [Jackrogersella minutella]|nr:Aldo/keto reductase [Jackrogersella minutella]